MKKLEDLKQGMKIKKEWTNYKGEKKIDIYEIVGAITIKTKSCMTRVNHKTEWIEKTFADTIVTCNDSKKLWGRIFVGKNGEYIVYIED